MAALCTVAPVAAAAQHVANFPKTIGQISVPVAGVPQSSHLKKVNGRIGDGLDYSGDDFQRSDRRIPMRKQLVGDCLNHGRSRIVRSKAFITVCVITTAVVEPDTELKDLKDDSSSIPTLNTTSTTTSSDPDASGLLLKPSPRPVPLARPKLIPPVSKVEANPPTNPQTSGTRWVPKPNGVKRGETDSSFKQTFRPGDKPLKPNGGTEFKAPIESLGQILEKAEKLSEQHNSSPVKDGGRFAKSTWRKGDTSSARSPPKDVSQVVLPKNEASQDNTVRSSAVSQGVLDPLQDGKRLRTNDVSAPAHESSQVARVKTSDPPEPSISPIARSPVRVDANKPEARRPQLNVPLNPPSREGPQLAKKQIILRDVGAAPRAAGAAAVKPQGSREKTMAAKTAAAAGSVGAPPKPGKTGAPKGKDGKDDRRKKVTVVVDGPKRRMGSKSDDAIDADIPGSSGSARRGGRKMTKASRKAARVEAAKAGAPVRVDILEVGKQGMSVPDLAAKLAVNVADIVKTLFMKGIVSTVNQTLDEDTIKLVCQEYDVEVVEAGIIKLEDMATKTREFLDDEDLDHLELRPPIVTVMGHVDHGKTSLLDYIRKTKVAAGEAGGITQGIGAYCVPVTVDGEVQSCVFLDTPGHEAFSAMRARGARVTDVAIIVVAADDGVRPQTQEAIAHAKAANVPIVMAINKIDKEGAEPDRVMQELSSIGLLPEAWGGDVPMVQVSALKGQNVDTLLETVMLVAEFQDLKANPNRSAKGTVIESCLDKTRGVVATLLVQNGTLKKGDVVISGEAYGKVRALLDDTGTRVDEAGPSTAVQVIGLNNVPVAGDEFEVLDSLEVARDRAEQCAEAIRLNRLAAQAAEGKVTLSSLANFVSEGQEGGVERHQLNVVLKVDVQGTLEAIREVLASLPQDTVNLRMLLQAAGDVTTSDVDLAIASEAIIIGFNVGVQSGVQTYAESKGVEIRMYKVIYELIDDIRKAMEGLLDPVKEQVPIGAAEVRAIFSSGSGKVAGCMVTDGKLVKGCGCKVVRGGTVVHTGTLNSLRRVKELAKEVIAGLECGAGVEDFNEWQEGDIIEAFNLVAKKRTLEEASVNTASSLAAVSVATSKAS